MNAVELSRALINSVDLLYKSLSNPVEGTILSVIKAWTESFDLNSKRYTDFEKIFKNSLADAKHALAETPNQLDVLAEAGVVDSGAKGFVDFIEGIHLFIKDGAEKPSC